MIYQYDNTPPTLSITSPTGTSSGNPAKTQGGYITVNGTAKDEANGSGVKRVLITVNNGTPIEVIPNGNGSFSYNVVLTDYNVNTVGIQAEDNAGNLSGKIVVYTKRVVKNTSVITWPDALTMEVIYGGGRYVGWLTGGKDGPHYSGNRESNRCSVSGSSYANRGQNEYVADSCWAQQIVHGKIYANTRIISISSSRSWSAEGNNTVAVPNEYGYIYDVEGKKVANLYNGNNNVNAYNDGNYYFYIFRGSGSYGAWAGGSCSSNCSVNIYP